MSLTCAGPSRPFGQDLAEAESARQVPARRQIHTGIPPNESIIKFK